MTKIIFLDCDGVINKHGSFVSHKHSTNLDIWPIDKVLLGNLRSIVAATGADIVMSSTWRRHPKAFGRVQSACRLWARLIGKTPRMDSEPRHKEISAWFETEGVDREKAVYAVIDDDPTAGGPHPFFQTTMRDGLTVEITNRVIKHLGLKDDDAGSS